MALHPYDLFDVRSLLNEEERAVQESVARFTNERVLPIIGDAFDQARFPSELVPEIASLGLLGATLPAEYGGGDLGAVSYGLICQGWSAATPACAASFRCRARCACTRSTPMAARNSASSGCRRWRAAS
jgi:alkylation response protein AidB-like acyl-CoA dehydrogenase